MPSPSPNVAPHPKSTTSEASPIFSTTTGASIDPTAERRGFDFRHFWHALIERIWVVVLCVLAGLFIALGYLARTPKLYQGHIVLEVEFAEPTFVNAEDSALRSRSTFLASQEALRTIEQNLTNRSLLARVVRAEGLADDGGRALLGQSLLQPKNPPPLLLLRRFLLAQDLRSSGRPSLPRSKKRSAAPWLAW